MLSVIDLNTGKVKWHQSKAHKAGINAVLVEDDNLLFTGDDDGGVRVRFRFCNSVSFLTIRSGIRAK